jgi:hypothetical protein
MRLKLPDADSRSLSVALTRKQVEDSPEIYPGEHQAIIEPGLWDAVQARLAANAVERSSGRGAKNPSLLVSPRRWPRSGRASIGTTVGSEAFAEVHRPDRSTRGRRKSHPKLAVPLSPDPAQAVNRHTPGASGRYNGGRDRREGLGT